MSSIFSREVCDSLLKGKKLTDLVCANTVQFTHHDNSQLVSTSNSYNSNVGHFSFQNFTTKFYQNFTIIKIPRNTKFVAL